MRNKLPFEYRITFAYILVGVLWILFSDQILYEFTKDPLRINNYSIYKGSFFIFVTGLLLFILIKKEIKKRTKLYNQLLVANKKALESEKLKSAFLSNLSHYIRTPMNSILGFADLVQNRNLDEEKRNRFLSHINERSHHLLDTINNIIEISKLEADQLKIERCSFSVNELLSRLFLSFENNYKIREKQITLCQTISLEDGKDMIDSDYGKIYHIFYNLLNNAFNFTDTGEIEIGYHFKEDKFIFFVRDTGKGIPHEKQGKLFTNYMEGTSDVQNISEGTGIGLYLSARLTVFLGGVLWLDYSNLSGSKFCFSIPQSYDYTRVNV